MVSEKGKDNASTSDASPKNDTAETTLTPTTVSSPDKTMVISESTDKVENAEEVNDEGKAMVAVNNEEDGKAEDNDEENDIAEEETNEENAMEEDAIDGEDGEDDEGDEQNEEKSEENSKGKGRKPRKRIRKKKAAEGSEKVATDGDKPESSSKNKPSKRVESMGMVFMCSSKTKNDCFRYKILGLPASKKDQVQKIYKGMRLFLFDVDLRLMYGIFKAAGRGGYNIEPKAFKSAFPSQVKFTVMEDCLPLAEEKFKKVIKENYYTRNKFDCQLNSEQVKKLCKLFVVPGKSPSSKKAGQSLRTLREDAHTSIDKERQRKRRVRDEERRPPSRREWVRNEDRRPASGRERRLHERPVMYEREAFASPVAPVARYLPLPAPAPAPAPAQSYFYERPSEMHPYARDPLLEHRGLRLLESEPRRHYEIGNHDPYVLYREPPPPYRDTVYSLGQTSEYRPQPPAALPSEYRLVGREYHSSAGRPIEYHSSAGRLVEYHSSLGQPAEYHLSSGLRPDYPDVGPTIEYRASASSLPEYPPRRTHYRY